MRFIFGWQGGRVFWDMRIVLQGAKAGLQIYEMGGDVPEHIPWYVPPYTSDAVAEIEYAITDVLKIPTRVEKYPKLVPKELLNFDH